MNRETNIYCLTYGCPKNNRDNDCPLLEIENLSFKEKMDWIDELDDEKKEAILKHHANCTKNNDKTFS